MNTCDKCQENVHELDLIWITTEDFAPLEDEEIIPEKAVGIDAICHNCYGDIIRIKLTDKEIINGLIDYNYQLSKTLEDLVPEWYYKSELIAEINDWFAENIDGTEHSNE